MTMEITGYVYPPLLTIGDAAKFLGVGRKMIYQLIEWGEIRVVKTRGTALIEKQSLQEFKGRGVLT
jgi:excisionase family DNA binding protein